MCICLHIKQSMLSGSKPQVLMQLFDLMYSVRIFIYICICVSVHTILKYINSLCIFT